MRSEVVAVGRVVSVDPVQSRQEVVARDQTVVIRILEAFKGAGKGELLTLVQENSSCTPWFAEGEVRLFYASTWGDHLRAGGCGRTVPVDQAGDDLLFLRGLPATLNRTRLSGSLHHWYNHPKAGFEYVGPVPSRSVEVFGAAPLSSFELTTDEFGAFEVYDLAPGSYTVSPRLPHGLELDFSWRSTPDFDEVDEEKPVEIQVFEGACSSVGFTLVSNATVSGTLTDDEGTPLVGWYVRLVTAVGETSHYFRVDDSTDGSGSFVLRQVPPGDYLIVMSQSRYDHELAYYPGVSRRLEALKVKVGAGDHLQGYRIQLPSIP